MKLKVGLTYNLRRDFPVQANDPGDIAIEWCDEEYVKLLKEGIKRAGFEVADIGNPVKLMDETIRKEIDVLFSIAEMRGYRYRESIVPMLCEFFNLPYLFARPDGMMVTADKHLSNLVVERLGIAVPSWQLIKQLNSLFEIMPNFPCIVKPNAEGSSMGIDLDSVVYDSDALTRRVHDIITLYNEPAMVQEFVTGGEISVAVIQDKGKTIALSPLQVFEQQNASNNIFSSERKQSFRAGKVFSEVKNEVKKSTIRFCAEQIFDDIGCYDAARIDFREAGDTIYFIEINGLTDFHPNSAFCQSAKLHGLNYEHLLKTIILNGYHRFKRRQG